MGLKPLLVWCVVNEHSAVLYSSLGVDQFVVECILDNSNNPCFACTKLQAPGEVAHVQLKGTSCLPACGLYLCGRASLSVGSSMGLSLLPCLAVLVPVVLRDAMSCQWLERELNYLIDYMAI